jgi:hypothetical protein
LARDEPVALELVEQADQAGLVVLDGLGQGELGGRWLTWEVRQRDLGDVPRDVPNAVK